MKRQSPDSNVNVLWHYSVNDRHCTYLYYNVGVSYRKLKTQYFEYSVLSPLHLLIQEVCVCVRVCERARAHVLLPTWSERTRYLFRFFSIYIFTSRKLTDGPDDALSYSRSLCPVGSVLRTVVGLVFAEVWDHIVYYVIGVSVKGTKKQVN